VQNCRGALVSVGVRGRCFSSVSGQLRHQLHHIPAIHNRHSARRLLAPIQDPRGARQSPEAHLKALSGSQHGGRQGAIPAEEDQADAGTERDPTAEGSRGGRERVRNARGRCGGQLHGIRHTC